MPGAATLAVMHCGAGCTLGDIAGSFLVFLFGLSIAGLALWSELVVDFVLAFSLGIVFQYFTIAPMRLACGRRGRGAQGRHAVAHCLRSRPSRMDDFVQILAFPEPLVPTDPTFWFMMQIGMAIGFVTAYPVNWWLVSAGLKERM